MKIKTSAFKKNILISLFVLISFSLSNLIAQNSNIPDWFLNTSKHNSKNFAIGVSNPDLDSKTAYSQAKIRALLNYSILHNSTVKSLTTLSMGSQISNPARFENIEYIIYTIILSGKMPQLNQVTVIDSFYNSNKEAFILLRINDVGLSDSSDMRYHLTRRSAFQNEHNNFHVAIDDLTFTIYKSDSILESFILEKDGYQFIYPNQNKKKSVMDVEKIRRPYYYGIAGSILGDKPENSSLPCLMHSGLWNAYIFSMLDLISISTNFEHDLQYKLSTNNIGNQADLPVSSSFQQLVYSLKNLNSSTLAISIQKMGISANQLYIGLAGNNENLTYNLSKKGKSAKKEIKKLKEEDWKVLGRPDLINAWFAPSELMKNEDLIHATSELQTTNLQSGIIEAINLAKLELSSQLGSKVNSLNNLNNSDDGQIYLNSSKLSNKEKTAKIDPYFIFYSKINDMDYKVKVVLFCSHNQRN